ncbi:MAG TPA: hypothetical protein VGR47_18415 [Terracidiphilus sp.]|nr:hypothetical protein [Terracidiphilus sp.]
MAPSLAVRSFGLLPNGATVEAWTLKGAGALVAEIITYGATVTRVLAPDRKGRVADVVLGFSNGHSFAVLWRYPSRRLAYRKIGSCL